MAYNEQEIPASGADLATELYSLLTPFDLLKISSIDDIALYAIRIKNTITFHGQFTNLEVIPNGIWQFSLELSNFLDGLEIIIPNSVGGVGAYDGGDGIPDVVYFLPNGTTSITMGGAYAGELIGYGSFTFTVRLEEES